LTEAIDRRSGAETYCYAFAAFDFLENEQQQLYWRTDIVQMTGYYMLEAGRSGIALSPRRAGFPIFERREKRVVRSAECRQMQEIDAATGGRNRRPRSAAA